MATVSPENQLEQRPGRDRRLARAVRSLVCISREFEQIGRRVGVSLPQYRLLLFLRHGPERAGELAAKVAIKRPTLTALVTGLEREGRLRRVADERDGRGVRIELTPRGLDALQAVERHLSNTLDQMITQGDREGILDALDELAGIVDDDIARRVCPQDDTAATSTLESREDFSR